MTTERPPEIASNAERSTPRPSHTLELVLIAVCAGIAIFVLWPLFNRPHSPLICLSNMKHIALGLQIYLEDNDGRFPLAERWQPSLNTRSKDVFVCPKALPGVPSYAHNPVLFGMGRTRLAAPDRTIFLFESDDPWSPGVRDLPRMPRHTDGDNYGFADGHVEWLPRKHNPDGTWAKEPEAEVVWEVEE